MGSRLPMLASVLCIAFGCSCGAAGEAVELPRGSAGIGFDDLRYSTRMSRVLVPAGRAGALDLVDPRTDEVTEITGFSTRSDYGGGHDDGPTSVDEGAGFLFVTDRTSDRLDVVDPQTRTIVAQAPVGPPDYVRWVEATRELWVTEPGAERIEVFALGTSSPPDPTPVASIRVENGPESLVIDEARGRAYTHRWQRETVAIDLVRREIVEAWPNGCAASRGLALDAARGWLIVGCNEGTTSVLDVAHGGRRLSSISRGSGFDVIGYNPVLGHAYLAGGACGCLVMLGVSRSGELSYLGRFSAPSATHCVAADDLGQAWVCDPSDGSLVRVRDPYPATLVGGP